VRRRVLDGAVALALALLFAAGCTHARPGSSLALQPLSKLPRSSASHVLLIVMENEESSDVLGSAAAPYTNSLVHRYGFAGQSYAIAHPSLPNYLALTSGSTNGVSSDCSDCHVRARNIVDQLEAARISWKAYLEDAPSPCFRGATAGGYAKKHNPFIYYDDIARSRRRCGRLVGFAQLAVDLRDGRLPTYAWITPNLCDDGHDCGVSGGDRFLARTVPALARELGPHGFLVLTWDEGSTDRGCCAGAARGGQIATVLVGPDVRHGAREDSAVDHYGVLGTIEQALHLPPLAGAADPRSGRLTPLFARRPRIQG
jgi:phosphatidylinositol-3-phosphatase